MLLGEVADLQPVARDHAALAVGALHPGEQLEQGGLAGAVGAQHDHARALVHRQVHAREDLEGAVHLCQALAKQRGLAARRRLREGDGGDLVGHPDLVELPHHALSARHHLLRGRGLRGLRTQLRGLLLQG